MPRRAKEENKTETIIRSLLKQPDNMRCINCNSLGPQYVCTTYWTFICTSCSGVHREFNHRVKSVSMAKFNEEEIMAIQAGGNERAKEIYFKTWDPQCNSYPERGNLQRIREFVNHVYIDRRYCGENNSNKLSMVKLDSRSNSCEWPSEKSRWGRRGDSLGRSSFERTSNSGGDDFYGRSSFDKASPSNNKVLNLKDFLEARSPRSIQENARSSSLRNCPTRFEIVDDRYREDGRVKTYERHSRKETRGGSMSPRTRSFPAISPVKVILGEKDPVLRIEGPLRANDGKDAESSARVEKAADATIPGPTGGKEEQNNGATLSSLIDFFDAEPEPVSNPRETQALPTASNTKNECSSVATSNQAVTKVQNMNSMDSVLLEWPSPVASGSAGKSNSFGTENSNMKAQDIQRHQLPSKQQIKLFDSHPGNTSSSTQQSATSVESSSNQHWNKSLPLNDRMPVQSVPPEQLAEAVNPGEGSTPCARKEIPQDLFTSNYTSFTPAVAGWHMHPSHRAVYGMQFHHPAMSAATFPDPPKPRNPFDIADDRYQVHGAIFPSMSSLQKALPNMQTSTALESQPSPYTAAPPSHSQVFPYGNSIPLVPRAYMGQLSTNMPPTRSQGNANFDRAEDAFAALNPIQHASGTDSLPVAPTSLLPRVGNPFG